MRNARILFALPLALALSGAAHGEEPPARAAEATPAAAALPPDMKQYWFVMLSKGPRRTEPLSAEAGAELQAGHMAHMASQREAGRLLLAGPFGDDGDWRGIQIYDADSQAEVEAICAGDPAVQAGRLACEVRPWWGQVGSTLR